MSKDKTDAYYFVFYRDEDEPHRHVMTKDELTEELNDPNGSFAGIEFGTTVPYPDSWPARYGVIIKGEIIQPKATQVVTKLGVE